MYRHLYKNAATVSVDLGNGYSVEYDDTDPTAKAYVERVRKKSKPLGILGAWRRNWPAILLATAAGTTSGAMLGTKDRTAGAVVGGGIALGTSLLIKALQDRNTPTSMPAEEALAKSAYAIPIEDIPEDVDGNIFRTTEDYTIKTDNYKPLTIPKGFKYDGASIPWILQPFFGKQDDPRTIRAALAHDYLYRHAPKGYTRQGADAIFKQLLIEDGMDETKADLMLYAVNKWGNQAWAENRTRREALRKALQKNIKVYKHGQRLAIA